MKKIVTIGLILALCFTFISCVETRQTENGSSPKESGSLHESVISEDSESVSSSEIVKPIDELGLSGTFVVQADVVIFLDGEAKTMTYSQFAGYNEFLTNTPKFTWTETSEGVELEGGLKAVQATHGQSTYRLTEKDDGVYLKIISGDVFGEFEVNRYDEENYKLPDYGYIYKTKASVPQINSKICLKLSDGKISIYYTDTLNTGVTPNFVIENYRLEFSGTNLFINKTLDTGENFSIRFIQSGIGIRLNDDPSKGIVGYSATCTI